MTEASRGVLRVSQVDWLDPEHLMAVRERNPAGHETTFMLHSAHDSVVRIIDPNGEVADFSYDGFGRLATSRDTAGVTTSLTFMDSRRTDRAYAMRTAAVGRPVVITDFDRLDRPRETLTANFNGDVVEQNQEYDALGRLSGGTEPALVGQPSSAFFRIAYDELDRVARLDRVDAATLLSEVWTTAYDVGLETTPGIVGVRRTVTDPNRHSTATYLDSSGAVERVVDALQGLSLIHI